MALQDIDTFIVVILENRSFDHMLGYLSLAAANPPIALEGLRDDPAWRNAQTNFYRGNPFPLHEIAPAVQTIDDPPHEERTIDLQINTPAPGKMGGFVESYMTRQPAPSDPTIAMGYYTKKAVPVFDFFARNFAVCDHWFCALPTGTQANRLMAMSGESSIVDNAPVFLPDQDLVYDWLTDHNVPWCTYQYGNFFPFFTLMKKWSAEIATSLALSRLGGRGRFRLYSRFREHWLGNAPLPRVIFVEPEYTDGPHTVPNDDHPPTGVAAGQAFLADLYNTLIKNKTRWQKTMMIVTYDEHGGFFDHVPPLPIPATVAGFQFKTTGVRVPAFVVSPHVEPGSVFSGNLDHTSLLQLLADRFNPAGQYSPAVGARQTHLVPLSTILKPVPPAQIAAPAMPKPMVTALTRASLAAAPPAQMVRASGANATALAFRNIAATMAEANPELVREAGWSALLAPAEPMALTAAHIAPTAPVGIAPTAPVGVAVRKRSAKRRPKAKPPARR
jgi:phospholipase C